MKLYRVHDLQECNFMDDTHEEPMKLNDLRHRFWCLDDIRTEKYSEFTRTFIEDTWEVRFEEVKK